MGRTVSYNVDANGFPIEERDEEYDISELKQVLESSNIRENADPNKMHYDSLENMAEAATPEEAQILSTKLVERYPEIVCSALQNSLVSYRQKFSAIEEALK